MNCLLFSVCISIKRYKNKAKLSLRWTKTMKNQWGLGKLVFKVNIWHPVLENACDYVKSNWLRSCGAGLGVAKLRCYLLQIDFASNRIISINEIYEDIHQCVSSLFYTFFSNFELNASFGIFWLVKTSIAGPSSSYLLVTADEEHSIQ